LRQIWDGVWWLRRIWVGVVGRIWYDGVWWWGADVALPCVIGFWRYGIFLTAFKSVEICWILFWCRACGWCRACLIWWSVGWGVSI
jgi:hypothetical protein